MKILTKLCFLNKEFLRKDYIHLKLAINLRYLLLHIKRVFNSNLFEIFFADITRNKLVLQTAAEVI